MGVFSGVSGNVAEVDTPMLTDAKIKAARPSEKPYKLTDGDGLYLLINPDGSRWWRVQVPLRGQGEAAGRSAPTAGQPGTLNEGARDRLARAQATSLRDGIDPSAARKAEKLARIDRADGARSRSRLASGTRSRARSGAPD